MNCTVDGCLKEATHTFVWPWGAEGACCSAHIVIVQQRATQTRGPRGAVTFVPLAPDRPREVTRDERVALVSKAIAAEAERDEQRIRSSQLFDANKKLHDENRALRLRIQHFEANEKTLRSQFTQACEERDAALVSVDKAREQLEALGIEGDRTTPPEPHSLAAHGIAPLPELMGPLKPES